MKNFLKKITSRKFLLALFSGITWLCVTLNEVPSEKIKIITTIFGALSIILYQVVEGKLDLKALTVKKAEEIFDKYKENQKEDK